MIYGLGMLEMGMTLSYAQLVMDNDAAKMVRRVLQGIPVTDETLAVDLIKQVGARENFLAEEHTVKYMRQYLSQPQIIDRNMRDMWETQGSKDMPTRATEKAIELLESHTPDPLPEGAEAAIRLMIEDTEKELGVISSGK